MSSYSRQRANWRQQQLARLQSQRNKLLRSKPPAAVLAWHLPVLECQIAAIQREITDITALRAGQRWRELGETSAGYLKRTIFQRQAQRTMPVIVHPVNGNLCETPASMQDAARTFYQELYTAEPLLTDAMSRLLSNLPPDCCLSFVDGAVLTHDFAIEDLQNGAKRCPRQSSAEPDGLPYGIWHLVFQHPAFTDLILAVYNEAFAQSRFPRSWTETAVYLLPKKGDLSSLRNWRPISLINCDVKIFTRLLNSRIVQVQ